MGRLYHRINVIVLFDVFHSFFHIHTIICISQTPYFADCLMCGPVGCLVAEGVSLLPSAQRGSAGEKKAEHGSDAEGDVEVVDLESDSEVAGPAAPSNFERSVFGCIEAEVCNQILFCRFFRNRQDLHASEPLQSPNSKNDIGEKHLISVKFRRCMQN